MRQHVKPWEAVLSISGTFTQSSVHKQQLWVTYIFFACLLMAASKKTSVLLYEDSIWHENPFMSLNTEVDAEQMKEV